MSDRALLREANQLDLNSMEAPSLMTDSIWISRRNELHMAISALSAGRPQRPGPHTDESSVEAIMSIDLKGTITSWSLGAQRLFGYEPQEAICRPETILIPADLLSEAPTALDYVLKGDRVEYRQTAFMRKDSVVFQGSVTIVPVKDSRGNIVGVSKVVRNVTDRTGPKARWDHLLEETHDRLRDIIALSSDRFFLKETFPVQALDRAEGRTAPPTLHPTFADIRGEGRIARSLTLHALIRGITARYDRRSQQGVGVVSTTGADIPVSTDAVVELGRVLVEFAEESARRGALSARSGRVDIVCLEEDDEISLIWTESGGPEVEQPDDQEGMKDFLARRTVGGRLQGRIVRAWRPEGIAIRVSAPRALVAEN
jgi:PAS domain S-box-containing protein